VRIDNKHSLKTPFFLLATIGGGKTLKYPYNLVNIYLSFRIIRILKNELKLKGI
jgi:hypothetical protein